VTLDRYVDPGINLAGGRHRLVGLTRVPKSYPYREVVTDFTEELDFLSDDELEWIMGKGLAAWLNWRAAT
jgi:hypothetical protein